MELDQNEVMEKFFQFVKTECSEDLGKVITLGKKSFIIDFTKLDTYEPDIAQALLDNPVKYLDIFEDTLVQFEEGLSEKIFVRFINLPNNSYIKIRDIRSKHLGKFLHTDGIIRQASAVRPTCTLIIYKCLNCEQKVSVIQDVTEMKSPERGCPNCGAKRFEIFKNKLVDTQRLVLEESSETLDGGQPMRLNIILKNDLVEPEMVKRTNPGSKVKIVGIVNEYAKPIPGSNNKSVIYDIILDANNIESVDKEYAEIEVTSDDIAQIELLSKDPEIYEKLIKSVSPSIKGRNQVKEALVLQMFGGVRKEKKDGTKGRGDIHILLIGDPGTGKSQLVKSMSTVAPKARFVSGKGATGAGLTATVVKDEILRGWALEAGALVLANKGILCIDEIDKMTPEDRSAMHEAMEQQSFHYNTIISLADGSETKIGDYIENLMKKDSKNVIKGINCLILPIKSNEKLLTTDWNTINEIKIDRVSKHSAPKYFYKIKICNGREIIVTPEHPIFCIENGEIITKPAEKLNGNEWVPIPLKLPIKGTEQEFENNNIINKRALNHIKIPCHNSLEFFKIIGYFLSEGSKETNRKKIIGINFTNKDKRLLDDFENCMNEVFKIVPFKQSKIDTHEKRLMYRYSSTELINFIQNNCPEMLKTSHFKQIPQVCMKGTKKDVSKMLSCMFEGDGHVSKKERTLRIGYTSMSKRLCEQVQDLLLRFNIRSNLNIHKTCNKVLITGYENILNFLSNIGFVTIEKNELIRAYLNNTEPSSFVKNIVPNVSKLLLPLIKKYYNNNSNYGYSQMKFNYLKRNTNIHKTYLQKILNSIEAKIMPQEYELFNNLKKLANNEIGWEKIKTIEKIKNTDQEWTYDVTIEPTHTFISQNMILHNTISISKANVQAVLNCQTSILAAANPKLGRFDGFKSLPEQIDMPVTLLSRFDLIFPFRDMPDKESDKSLAQFILKGHQNVEINTPELPTDLLRKYVSYARQNIHPRLSDEAIEEIQSFFVNLRNKELSSSGGPRPVPLTPRQLEALIRLSEASAKVRLSPEVTLFDAKKAITLMKLYLSQLGMDPETNELDIDRVMSGTTTSQRSKIYEVMDLLKQLEKSFGKDIPI
ncbi:MAG: LAGLIDADG family homing endonuclease, partial [Candidatus Nanoarchaeia archaeon]|nr:LAGLIDADG family homing endonuclease [Candidatus Nanoarchaeia archaeon]